MGNAHDLGTLAYSPLLRGMLFGNWTADKTFAPTTAAPNTETTPAHASRASAR